MSEEAVKHDPMKYRPLDGVFDEMHDAEGEVNPIWRGLALTLARLGPAGLNRRDAQVRHLLEQDGATFHVYDDPEGVHRVWPLDPLPYLIGISEWQEIELQMVQRARLFEAIQRDIYGPQMLIRDRVIPPELVWTHPGYSRACRDIALPGECQLPIFAVDMTRDANGSFLAIGDRTQVPTGMGYALENRIVMSRISPDLFARSHVHRLARFFATLRSSLAEAAGGKDDPRVVILSPGSRNESYFEQSYLAGYLGYSLVEGSDLFVRNGKVWIRTLTKPEQVDVILRRVDYDYCDPLEFRGDSLLGVTGLTEVARRGNVAIVNPLGAGVLESAAMFAYLPDIASYFGIPQTLRQVTSWWCGDDHGRKIVLDNIDELMIKSVASHGKRVTLFGGQLTEKERDEWRQRIMQHPNDWVGQEMVKQATLPAKSGWGVEQRHAVLRGYLAGSSQGYEAMQGGLTRVSDALEPGVISNQSGSLSKDTWVVSPEETEKTRYFWIHPHHKLSPTSPEYSVSGRMAENLFWMGRYAERAESTANLLRTIAPRFEGDMPFGVSLEDQTTRQLLGILTRVTVTFPGFTSTNTNDLFKRPLGELFSLTDDRWRMGSLAFSLQRFVDASREVRDLLSAETRHLAGRTQQFLQSIDSQPLGDALSMIERLDDAKLLLQAFAGLSGHSLIHGVAWRFLDLGRRLERASSMITLLQAILVENHNPDTEERILEALLKTTDNDVNYLHRYGSGAIADTVLDLLLLEPRNPRAVMYQLKRLQLHLKALPDYDEMSGVSRPIIEATTVLRLSVSREVLRTEGNDRVALDELCQQLLHLLAACAEEISRDYFTKTTDQQRILSPL